MSLCSSDWPGTCYVDQSGFELTELSLSASQIKVPSLKTPSSIFRSISLKKNHFIKTNLQHMQVLCSVVFLQLFFFKE